MKRRHFLSFNTRPLDPHYGASELSLISPKHPVQNSLGLIPQIDPAGWQLTLQNPELQIFSLADLRSFPAVESLATLESIGNPSGGAMIGTARWRGLRLCDIFSSDLPYVNFTAADGYQTSLARKAALHPQTLLAYEMNGKALPPAHGYPLRLIVSGHYGFKMPKWITHIEASAEPILGFWESLGWSQSGEVQTHAAFTHPPPQAQIQGQIRLAGYAFSKHAITKVEVSIDGGEWIPTHLLPSQSWTRWFLDWYPEQIGSYQLAVRASDDQGFTQSEFPNPLKKKTAFAGNSLIHTLEVTRI